MSSCMTDSRAFVKRRPAARICLRIKSSGVGLAERLGMENLKGKMGDP